MINQDNLMLSNIFSFCCGNITKKNENSFRNTYITLENLLTLRFNILNDNLG